MLSAKDVASYFIELASKESENDLTNLKLQKILYYAQAESLNSDNKKLLFTDQIEAWQYGPVINDVYQWLKGCGAYPISAFDIGIDTTSISKTVKDDLLTIWEEYSKYSAGYLVDKTHEEGSPWKRCYQSGKSNIIPNVEVAKAKLQTNW